MSLLDAVFTVGWDSHRSTSVLGSSGLGTVTSFNASSVPITSLRFHQKSNDPTTASNTDDNEQTNDNNHRNWTILDKTISNCNANLSTNHSSSLYLAYQTKETERKRHTIVRKNFDNEEISQEYEEEIITGIMELSIGTVQEYEKCKEEYTQKLISLTYKPSYAWNSIELVSSTPSPHSSIDPSQGFWLWYRTETQHIYRSLSSLDSASSSDNLLTSIVPHTALSYDIPIVDVILLHGDDIVPSRYTKVSFPLDRKKSLYLAYRRGTRSSSLGHCYLEPTVLDAVTKDSMNTDRTSISYTSSIDTLPSSISSFIFPEGIRLRYAKEQNLSHPSSSEASSASPNLYPAYFTDDYLDHQSTSIRNRRNSALPSSGHHRRRSLSFEAMLEGNRIKYYDKGRTQSSSSNVSNHLTTNVSTTTDTYSRRTNEWTLLRNFAQPKSQRTKNRSNPVETEEESNTMASLPTFQYKVPPPKYRVTILTREDGTSYYVHSLVFYKQVTVDQQTLLDQLFRVPTAATATPLLRCNHCHCLFQTERTKADPRTPSEGTETVESGTVICPSCSTVQPWNPLSSSAPKGSVPLQSTRSFSFKGFFRETPKASHHRSTLPPESVSPLPIVSPYPSFVSSTRISQRSTLYVQQALSFLSSRGEHSLMKRLLVQLYLLVSRIQRIQPDKDTDVHLYVLSSLFASRNHAVWNIPKLGKNDTNDNSIASFPPVITLLAYVQYLLGSSIPLPRPSHTIRIPSLFTDLIDPLIALPDRYALPSPGASNFTLLVQCFSGSTLGTIWKLLLLEQKLLIHSSVDALLVPLCEALVSLLFPLKWSGVYIPSCPSHMRYLLECPTPFLIGLPTRQLPRRLHFLNEDIYIIDVDHDRVTRRWVSPPTVTVTTTVVPKLSTAVRSSDGLETIEPKILRLRRYAHDDCLYGSDSLGDPFIYPSLSTVPAPAPVVPLTESTLDIELPEDLQTLFTDCLKHIAIRTGIRPGFGVPRYTHRIFPTKRLLLPSLLSSSSLFFGGNRLSSSAEDQHWNTSFTIGIDESVYGQMTNAEMYDRRNEEFIRNELRNCALLGMVRLLSGYRSHVLWRSATVRKEPSSSSSVSPVHLATTTPQGTNEDNGERTFTRLSSFRTLSSVPTNVSQLIGSPSSECTESMGSFDEPKPVTHRTDGTVRPPLYHFRSRASTFATVPSAGSSKIGSALPNLSRQQRGESSGGASSTNVNLPEVTLRSSYKSSPLGKPLTAPSSGTDEATNPIETDELHLDGRTYNAPDYRPSSVSNISHASSETSGEPFRERLITLASQVTRLSTVSDSIQDTTEAKEISAQESGTGYRKQRPVRPLRIYSPHPAGGSNVFVSPHPTDNPLLSASSSSSTTANVPSDTAPPLCFIFDSRRFLACVSSVSYVTFLRELIETQAFVSFLQLRAQVPTYLSSPPLSLSSPAAAVARKRRGSSLSRISTPRETLTPPMDRTGYGGGPVVAASPVLIQRLPPKSYVPIPPRSGRPTETERTSIHRSRTKSPKRSTVDPIVSFFDSCVDTVRRWPNLASFISRTDPSSGPSVPYLSEIGQYGPSLAASSHGRCLCGDVIIVLNEKKKEESSTTFLQKYRLQRHRRKLSAPAMVTASTGNVTDGIDDTTDGRTNVSVDTTKLRCTRCGLYWSHHPVPLTSTGTLPLASGITDTAPNIPSLLSTKLTYRISHAIRGDRSLFLPILYGYWPNNLVQDHDYITNMIKATERTLDPPTEAAEPTIVPNPTLPSQAEPVRGRTPNTLRVQVPKERSPSYSVETKPPEEAVTASSSTTTKADGVPCTASPEPMLSTTERTTTVPPTVRVDTVNVSRSSPLIPSPTFTMQHHEIMLQNLSSILGIIRNECLTRRLPIDIPSVEPHRPMTPSPVDSEIFAILRTPKNEDFHNNNHTREMIWSTLHSRTVPIVTGRNTDEEEWDNRLEDIDTKNKVTVYQWGAFHSLTIYLNYIEYLYAQLHWSAAIHQLSSLLSTVSIVARIFISIVRLGSRIGITTTKHFPASVPSSTPFSIKYSIPLTIEGAFRILLQLVQLALMHPSLSTNDTELLRSTIVYVTSQFFLTTPTVTLASFASSSNWNNELVRSVLLALHSDTLVPFHYLLRDLILKHAVLPTLSTLPSLPLPLRLDTVTTTIPVREIHSLWYSCCCSTCSRELAIDRVHPIHQGYVSEDDTLALWNTNPRQSAFHCGICSNVLHPRLHVLRWKFRYVPRVDPTDTGKNGKIARTTSSSAVESIVSTTEGTKQSFTHVWRLDSIRVTAYPYMVPSSTHLFTTVKSNEVANVDSKVTNLRWVLHRLHLPVQYVPIDQCIYRSTESVDDLFTVGGTENMQYTIVSSNGEVAITKTLSLLQQCQEKQTIPYIHNDAIVASFNDEINHMKMKYSLGIGTIAAVYPHLLPVNVTFPQPSLPTLQILLGIHFRPLVTLLYHGQIKEAVKYFIHQRRIYRTYKVQRKETESVRIKEMESDIGLGERDGSTTWTTNVENTVEGSASSLSSLQTLTKTKESLKNLSLRDDIAESTNYYPWENVSIFKTLLTLVQLYTPYLLTNIYARAPVGSKAENHVTIDNATDETLAAVSSLYTNGFPGTTGIGVLSKTIFTQSLAEWIYSQSLHYGILADTRNTLSSASASNTGTETIVTVPVDRKETDSKGSLSTVVRYSSSWIEYLGWHRTTKATNEHEPEESATATIDTGQTFEEVVADTLVQEIEEEALCYGSSSSTSTVTLTVSSPTNTNRCVSIITPHDWPSTKLALEMQRQLGYPSL